MRSQSLVILVAAILFGLLAVFVANAYLGRVEQKQATAAQGTTKVAVARVPLEFGTPVTPDKIKLVDWPTESLPDGTFSSVAQLTPMGKTHVALRPIQPNEPILRSKLSGEGGRATISAVLKAGMRAASVRVNDVAGVAGFVLPGDTVDVLITRTPTDPQANGQQITDVLLQKQRVIAIDQDANDNSDKPSVSKTATLEVSQVDAQKLALAQQVGTLSLVLRNAEGDTSPVVETISVEDLRDGAHVGGYVSGYTPEVPVMPARRVRYVRRAAPAARPAAPKPALPTVEVIRGTKNTSYEVGRYVGL